MEIRSNTTNRSAFQKRFYRWFDPFLLMKYAHFSRDRYYSNVPVSAAAKWLLEHYFGLSKKIFSDWSTKEILEFIRLKWN